jgi:hypothetical protein
MLLEMEGCCGAYETELIMEQHLNSCQDYFLHLQERGLYRVRALLARQNVFRRTVQDCTLSLYNEVQFLVHDWGG